ncbi:MAG: SpoIIE family protein phosphatase, partial [Chloroflexales bacterium]|nr:SpoIIE family protein phosphatase [Chloroflexales bacterium]
QYIDAGHGLALLRHGDGSVEELEPGGAPVGVPQPEPFRQGTLRLVPGDTLILFSDGLLDTWAELARDFTVLGELLEGAHGAEDILHRVLALPALVGPVSDDLTVVVLAVDTQAS